MKKPLKTSSKTAVKKPSSQASAQSTAKASVKAKTAAPAKKLTQAAPSKSAKGVAPKPAAKVATKAAPKAAPKAASKVVSKASPKGPAKPVPKAKPAPKVTSNIAVKTAPKSAPKSAPKAAPKAISKLAPKLVAKTPVKATPKAVEKPVVKPIEKAAPKAPVKVPAKTLEKAPTKTPANASLTAKVEKPAKPAKAEKPVKNEKTPPVLTPAVAVEAVAPGDVPARAVRPSARLAQITVPSMAQSVASTAAKASYLQNMPTQALTPPPFVAVKKDPKLANNWKTKKPDQLTDAEVMAMSDNDYMNDAQLAFFRIKLVHLKQGILANAGETTEHLREDTVVVPDPADRATIEEEHALELRTRDRERKLLKKIEQSIQRIDAGDYGYCDETGEPIGVGRLLARPTANLSLEAQQRRELKQKMFGD